MKNNGPMKRAVITGATGVVGTALIKELREQDVELLVLLREGSPHNARIPDEPGILKCVCSLDSMAAFSAPDDRRWDVFYHLGWSGTKGTDRFDPRIHTQNVFYTLDAVDLAERLGCKCFIGAGSQAEYGRQEKRLTPDTPTHPENAYGAGKLSAGHMSRLAASKKGMVHIWTRILSLYGPNDGERTLVTDLVSALLEGRHISTTKGEQVWDYLAAADAARALRMLGEIGTDTADSQKVNGKVFLIASGKERSLRSYIEEMRDLIAPDAEIGFGEKPYADKQVMHLTADISETTKACGWVPEISFADGIREMVSRIHGQ